ncbi:hypothetical protein E4T49_01576 [Aureobasidium sp. EXF-10728]|nr:hypothetical protein E4T49_01576 [Aureobasidium sp. EXF-10728]
MNRIVTRRAIRLAQSRTTTPSQAHPKPYLQHLRSHSSDTKTKDDQVHPLTGYYVDILSSRQSLSNKLSQQPTKTIQPQTQTPASPPPTSSLPKTEKEETLQKARIVFGSRLAGPSDRNDDIATASKEIAGVVVPPKPQEPSGDDCCMSGCVNCVWDIYREDFEEWRAKAKEARLQLQAQGTKNVAETSSVDDDGGGSETLWIEESEPKVQDSDPFANVPVGIREFMRTEKMLKQKHAKQGSKGG